MTGRATEDWSSNNPDAAIPPRVILRVFERCGGICALTGRKIRPGDKWQVDHRIALALGGAHAERNLQIVLSEPHKAKTASDVKAKSKIQRIRAKHLGVKSRKRGSLTHPTLKKKMDGSVVSR